MLAHLESERTADNGRQTTRHKLYLSASAIQTDSSCVVEILNISETGLLLNTKSALSPDEPLIVVLPEAQECVARIAWSGENLYGCQFDERLSKAELSAALLQAKPVRPVVDYLPNHTEKDTLGKRLKRLREASPYSMVEVAEMVGVTKPTLWKWETDKVRPREKAVQALARVFRTDDMTLLYGRHGNGSPAESITAQTKRPGDMRHVSDLVSDSRREIAQAAGVSLDQVTVSISWN